jgi:hypothetical protein
MPKRKPLRKVLFIVIALLCLMLLAWILYLAIRPFPLSANDTSYYYHKYKKLDDSEACEKEWYKHNPPMKTDTGVEYSLIPAPCPGVAQ